MAKIKVDRQNESQNGKIFEEIGEHHHPPQQAYIETRRIHDRLRGELSRNPHSYTNRYGIVYFVKFIFFTGTPPYVII